MTETEAWSKLLHLASDEFTDAAARLQEGADEMGTVPEWAGLVAWIASDRGRLARAAQAILSHHDEGARPDQIALDELRAALKETT
jgi:hypothetical protein